MSNKAEIFLSSANPRACSINRTDLDKPYHILILANFSAYARQATDNKQASYRTNYIDIDNFDKFLTSIKPKLQFFLDGFLPEVYIEFSELEDFHPDNLFKKLGIFSDLTKARQKLVDPSTFIEGAAELQKLLNIPAFEKKSPGQDVSNTAENDEQTLNRLLGETPAHAKPHTSNTEQVALSYIRNVISDHIVEDISSVQGVYIQAVDDAISVLMRKLLHHPEFQALEAAWRSLYLLVSSLETDETLSLHLLDIDKTQLAEELVGKGEDLTRSELYQRLVTQSVDSYGGQPWSLIIGNYTFSNSDDDLALLAAMGVLASHAGGPFIAAADPALVGSDSLTEQPDYRNWNIDKATANQNWQQLRKSAVAPWIGLALPRVLLRLPYGTDTDPVDCFNFEEFASDAEHEALLWGNPAFYCALLIARSYREQGWNMQLGDNLEVADLPAYIEQHASESKLKPCAEVCINDHTMEKMLELGVMPFLSHRSLNLIRLARFQSIALPLKALNAGWARR